MTAWGAALLRRALQAVLVAVLVGALCFVLVRALPGDMAFRIAASRYGYDLVSAQAADAVRAELGLDRPMLAQLGAWLLALLRGDLGVSLVSGERVATEIAHQLGATLLLSAAAMLPAAVAGPALGLLAGLRPGGAADRVGLVAAAVLRSMPSFAVGVGLMLLLAGWLDWLPASDDGTPAGIVLPALTLALGLAAGSSRIARDAVVGAMQAPAFGFALLKGLSRAQAVRRHVLRNAAVPVVAYLGLQFALLIEGVVVVEALFAWPGIGHAVVHAVLARDVAMVQGTVLALALGFVALNALTDLAVFALDPRRRA